MGAELLQFQPFGGVAAILLGGVTGHTRRTLGGVGPAFGALKSDNEPDALVFGHGRTLRRVRETKLIVHLSVRSFPIPLALSSHATPLDTTGAVELLPKIASQS